MVLHALQGLKAVEDDYFTKRTLDNMPISRKDATDAAYKGFVGSNNSSIQNLRRRAGIK